ncbi:uncharacterized protein B0P05DRAFT_564350 [Gilbertella persicaria]|uniref:uncharacterized protein n=1 Tax=Gilbertella persicaria TaxID=101096 RepID=UPI00221F9697|nr:uncharacterized protein B0P05DRAFT_564350 [Gilbertella persicaria]KAI8048597.1 hypothetical protein B0P05DRAFT_564350 [Gilbertella persicaria]
MDLQHLLCNATTSESYPYKPELQYEKQEFEYYPSPDQLWSSASSISSVSESSSATVASLSPISSPSMVSRINHSTNKHHQTRTPWTSSEDFLLEKGYLQGLSWAMISAKYLPHRSRGCCWGRFKTLQTKSTDKKNWSEYEDRILLESIKKHERLFKQAWRAVSLDLKERDWKECELRSTRISGLMLAQRKRRSHA